MVLKLINSRLKDENTFFVFPSEAVASQLATKVLKAISCRVLARHRFMSWDTFWAKMNTRQDEGPKADRVTRILFVFKLLAENRAKPFLRYFVNNRLTEAASAELNSIINILPHLKRLISLDEGLKRRISEDKYHDLAVIYERYLKFLEAMALKEPAYEDLKLIPHNNYCIFFPEVLKEFYELEEILKRAKNVEIVTINDLGRLASFKAVKNYPTVFCEITSVLEQIHGLLQDGLTPDEIVLTVGNLKQLEPWLLAQAELYDLRLNIKQAFPLLEYPGVNFIRQLAEIEESHGDYFALASFLSNKSLCFKNEALLKGLLDFGREFNCLWNYPQAGRLKDIWEERFSLAKAKGLKVDELAQFYRSLACASKKIFAATSFNDLSKALANLTDSFFIVGDWDADARRYWQYALSLLDQLKYWEGQLKDTGTLKPFAIWLELLKEVPYVKANSPEGIAVYPYKVSAGICPRCHFIIGASEAATRFIGGDYFFLTSAEKEELGLREPDLTDELFRLYQHSGEEVFISFAKQGLVSQELAPAFLLEWLTEEESPSPGLSLYQSEELFWQQKGEAPALLFSWQAEGMRRAELTHLGQGSDFSRKRIEDERLRSLIITRFRSQHKELISVSPTELEEFVGCPLRHLFVRVYGISAPSLNFSQSDARCQGRFYHRVFELFFKGLKGKNLGSGLVDFRQKLEDAFEEAVRESELYLPPQPVWETEAKVVRQNCLAFIEVTNDYFKGKEIAAVEQRYQLEEKSLGLFLHGKIDALFKQDSSYIIFDLKKGKAPTVREIIVDEGEYPTSLQMPFYIKLVEGTDKNKIVAGIIYYSLKEGKLKNPLGKKDEFLKAEPKAKLLKQLNEVLQKFGERILEGNFIVDFPAIRCGSCAYALVCRRRYFLEL